MNEPPSLSFKIKTEHDHISVATSPSDTRLNLKLLFMKKFRGDHDDIRKILSRFKSFRSAITSENDWCGLMLNMREFIRAMIIGTQQTIRTKEKATQTENTENSQETYFSDPNEIIQNTPDF